MRHSLHPHVPWATLVLATTLAPLPAAGATPEGVVSSPVRDAGVFEGPVVSSPVRDAGVFEGPVLPSHLAPTPGSYFVVGVSAESYGSDLNHGSMLGLEAQFRWRALGPYLFAEARPQAHHIADTRFIGALGLRGYFPLLSTEFSYGVGFRLESRLAEDFWLAHATPLELGAVVYSRHSWKVQLFVGVSRVMSGDVISWFLLNPNGIDNDAARDEVHRLRHEAPWLGFARIVFGRRLD